MTVSAAFEAQAKACIGLGSPFTARVLRHASAALSRQRPVGAKVLGWSGDASGGGDSVALRLAGGLHALVLSGADKALAAVYPPAKIGDCALKQAIADALINHADFLTNWLESPPQTNEIARSAPLAAAGHMIAARFGRPLRLYELGASAGLNLRWDKVVVEAQDTHLGPRDAPIRLRPQWHGELPPSADLKISGRAGVDLNPLDASNNGDRLRLLSYIWADQPDRLARMRRAIDLATDLPVKVARGDAAEWLQAQLEQPTNGAVTVIFNTVAWQYFSAATQARVAMLIEATGAATTDAAPLAWLSMEADATRDGAALSLRLWPGNHRISLGRADFHGRWVKWQAGAVLANA